MFDSFQTNFDIPTSCRLTACGQAAPFILVEEV
jgi:hypothetical protein